MRVAMADIHTFVLAPRKFRWGGVGGEDCMTFAASWVLEVTGVDPAENLRGTYRTRAEAHAIVDSYGGAFRFMNYHLSSAGVKLAESPRTGDVGLVRMMTSDEDGRPQEGEIGAIRFGPLWASMTPGGVVARKADMIRCWRLPE